MIISFKDTYSTLASSLIVTGSLMAVLAFLVLNSTPLTALGISTVIIGSVTFAISRGQPKIPPEASAVLLQSGVENISALVEELGLTAKAIYLPSSVSGDKPKALIPLDANFDYNNKVLPKRLIVKYGSRPESMGLLVVTPGSVIGGAIKPKEDYSAGDIESALSSVFSGTVCLADGARVTLDDLRVLVEVINPRLDGGKMWIYAQLGSPIASIVASVTAEVLDRPVSVASERYSRGRCVVELRVLGRTIEST
jgi:hypothetical protein